MGVHVPAGEFLVFLSPILLAKIHVGQGPAVLAVGVGLACFLLIECPVSQSLCLEDGSIMLKYGLNGPLNPYKHPTN